MGDSRQHAPNPHWKSVPATDIAWVGWDGSYAGYHRPSGRTHFLNGSSYSLVTDFLRSAQDLDSVLDSIASGQEPQARESLRHEVLELLEQLEHVGLIEKA